MTVTRGICSRCFLRFGRGRGGGGRILHPALALCVPGCYRDLAIQLTLAIPLAPTAGLSGGF